MQEKVLEGFSVFVASGPLIYLDAISLGRGENIYAITSFLLAHFESNFEKLHMKFVMSKNELQHFTALPCRTVQEQLLLSFQRF